MFLTHVLFKKAKSKFVMVMMQSVVSGHTFNAIRERLVDKLELIRFDPFKVHSVQNNRYNQLLKKLQSSSAEASPLAYEQHYWVPFIFIEDIHPFFEAQVMRRSGARRPKPVQLTGRLDDRRLVNRVFNTYNFKDYLSNSGRKSLQGKEEDPKYKVIVVSPKILFKSRQ